MARVIFGKVIFPRNHHLLVAVVSWVCFTGEDVQAMLKKLSEQVSQKLGDTVCTIK